MDARAPQAKTCCIESCDKPSFTRGWCSMHYSRWQRHGDPLAQLRSSPTPPDAVEKRCSRCTQTKPVDQFDRRKGAKNRPGSLKGYCRECDKEYYREYVSSAGGRERARVARSGWSKRNHEYFLKYRYDITLADYEALMAAQGGRCAICGTDQPGGNFTKWAVDHCHNSSKVRGLLCGSCNLGIGQLGDDPARLRAAADYIERHR
ncbi:hypothetical protein FHR83_007019 [Actinoplanes campanulatus]|uniref:Recombination endonuclease VII n=1 Tax=Actinoplanes campanulatus TaxID=113559 RepID=A0A7W5AN61_9ACTN|nr:endonuclease VII domain-containing protein [Actinoplanes campanulatus]MBB3099313.1 hypothetical protein [Actinoplanes campanulatus]GGN40520.1 hypothetical protein GCM10010109_69720 [Actinoplanes campanulatus]GID40631.1 hypothetical protein Aca09nite_71370 [Actinoplanes campanulatus]